MPWFNENECLRFGRPMGYFLQDALVLPSPWYVGCVFAGRTEFIFRVFFSRLDEK